MSKETIKIEEEVIHKSEGTTVTEEISVAANELMSTLKDLAQEATVRRLIVKKPNGDMLFEVPLVAGVAGLLVLGPWAAFLLVGAMLTNLRIEVERQMPAAANGAPAAPVNVTQESTQCQGVTKAGNQCKRKAAPGSSFCAQHQ